MSTLRFSGLLAAVAIAACSDGITDTDDDRGLDNGVSISPSAVSLHVGEIVALRFNGVSTRLIAIWSSDNPAIATVAVGGLVRGMQVGRTTVTARAGDLSASVAVTVVAAPLLPAPDTAGSACPSWAARRCVTQGGRPRPL